MKRASTTTILALCTAALLWGLSFVWSKIALEQFSVFTLVFCRFALASLIFWGILRIKGGIPKLTRRQHLHMMLLALTQPFLYFTFETLGISHTTASKASLITATIPFAVMALSALCLKERTTRAGMVGVILSVVGVILLVCGASDFSWALSGSVVGDMLMFGAVLSAAAYMVLTRFLGQSCSALVISFHQMAYGTLYFLPFFLWDIQQFDPTRITAQGIQAFVYLTLLCSVVAFLCYNYALTQVEASQASLFINAVPVVTVCAAWGMLGERLSLLQCIGGCIVLTAVLLPHLARLVTANRPVPQQT